MWRVVAGGEVSPHGPTITPPPTTQLTMWQVVAQIVPLLWH